MPFDYAALFSFVGLVSTFLGQTVVEYLIKKYTQDSVVILAIGAVVAVAMILMARRRHQYYKWSTIELHSPLWMTTGPVAAGITIQWLTCQGELRWSWAGIGLNVCAHLCAR